MDENNNNNGSASNGQQQQPNGTTTPPPPQQPGNAEYREVVDNLVSVIKEKHDDLDAKNNQIRDLMSRLERSNKRLGERDTVIDELKKKLDSTAPKVDDNADEAPKDLIFPVELFDGIFKHCSAKTRLNLAATSFFFQQRYRIWKDVTSLYITRTPIQQLPKATIIPQTYLVRTNSHAVPSFSSENLVAMASSLSHVKQMMIESNLNGISTQCNRIPLQNGFFSSFPKLESIKICNVSENLSLRYNLYELLALPNLKTLHVRELRADFILPESGLITAPIEHLRMSIAYRNHDKLGDFLAAFAPTLKSLDFSTLRSFMPISANVGGELIPAVTSKLPGLIEFHIPSVVSKHSTFDRSLPLLRNLTELRKISFEVMHLSALVNIVDHLPPSCETLVITDTLYIRGDMILLSHGSTLAIDKLFTGNNHEMLQFECNRIHRKLTIQLGRLRGTSPLTVVRNIAAQIQIISNATTVVPKSSSTLSRVYLWDGVILSRDEFLDRMGIIQLEQ